MMETCKTCKKPLEGSDAWLWGECPACRVERDKRHTRLMGCLLMPLWMPFWISGNLIGLVAGIFWEGFVAGLDGVQFFKNAWNAWKHKKD